METTNAIGRRKCAVARVYLKEGTGVILVNGRDYKEYFPTAILQNTVMQAFEISATVGTFDVTANLGGGVITVTDYWLVAENSAAGIVKVDQDKFMLVNNYVDQTGSTVIEFNAPYDMKGLEFNVYSILGSKVATKKFDVERGMNTVKFDGTLHASGLYVFTISDGNTTLTNKMYSK